MITNNLTQRVARLRNELQRTNSLNTNGTLRKSQDNSPLVFGWDQSWDQRWDQSWPQAWNQNGEGQGLHQHKKVESTEKV
jgi:hypothetical protein